MLSNDNDDLLMDFGEMTKEDIRRVVKEMQEREHEQLHLRSDKTNGAQQVAQEFIMYVKLVLHKLGLLKRADSITPIVKTERPDEPEDEEQFMRESWNEMAERWPIIESPVNYMITMNTLIAFFSSSGDPETILSLGSGPGLYESFLGYLLKKTTGTRGIRIHCIDYAYQMTKLHRRVLKISRRILDERLKNVIPKTGDMTDLTLYCNDSVDQVICNNSLQWADWREVISEVARVLDPDCLGWFYLFVHPRPMRFVSTDGEQVIERGDFSIPELFDELESHGFVIHNMRQCVGRKGTGQMGCKAERVFVRAKYEPDEKEGRKSWRDRQISSALHGL